MAKVIKVEMQVISIETKRFLEEFYSLEPLLRKRYTKCNRAGHVGEEVDGRCGYCFRLLDRTLEIDRVMQKRASIPWHLQPMDAPWVARRYEIEQTVLESNDLIYGIQKLTEEMSKRE